MLDLVAAIRFRHPRLGTRKLHHMIKPHMETESIYIGKDGLFRLLAQHGLLVRKRRRNAPQTTNSHAWRRQFPNLLADKQLCELPLVLVSDITYIHAHAKEDWYFLSLITELHSRMVLGFHVASTMSVQGLCLPALKMAVNNIPPKLRAGVIHHTDRGSQYLSAQYCDYLRSYELVSSTTQTGSPYENAVAERMNGIIKNEYLTMTFRSIKEAKKQISNAVELYNSERPHMSLGMKTPAEVWNSIVKDLL